MRAEPAAGPAYTIRNARTDDVPAVARIWHVGWADGHLGHVPQELVRYRREDQFVTRTQERVDTTWVAESDGQVVGFVVVKGDEVEQLYVDRAARGTGAAAMLLRKAETEILRAGHPRAWLAVVAGNHRARAFYSKSGWCDTGPLSYMAETEAGPFPVPTHRYQIELTGRAGPSDSRLAEPVDDEDAP